MGFLIAGGLILLLILLGLLRSAYEQKCLTTKAYDVANPEIPEAFDGVRILYLSDLHDRMIGPDNEKLIREIENIHPDYMILGGDMITVKPWNRTEFRSLRLLLERFAGEIPILVSDGNHESRMREAKGRYPGWAERYDALLSGFPLTLLRNRTVRLCRGTTFIRVAGVDFPRKYYRRKAVKNLRGTDVRDYIGRRRKGFLLVSCHNPVFFDALREYGADLVLSGHHHGGTVRLPILGGLVTPELRFFSPYAYGRIDRGNASEIIGAGLGTHSVNIRIFNKPELVLVTLRREETHD